MSALYLRLKMRKTFFLEKKNFREMSHSAEKCKRGTLMDVIAYILLQNIKKLEGGPFGHIKKFLKKSRAVPKKIQGDPLGTSGFVGFLEKVKNEKGTFWTKSPSAELGLRCSGGFRIVSKKWTDQCEDCSLKKKKSLL